MILGVEVAGVVEALGRARPRRCSARASPCRLRLRRGDGGYASSSPSNTAALVALPDGLAFEDAAGLMVQG